MEKIERIAARIFNFLAWFPLFDYLLTLASARVFFPKVGFK